MKNIKEHLKEKQGKKFQDCNFGIKEFNLKKRKLSPEEAAGANKQGTGKGKPIKPIPPPPNGSGGTIFLDFTGHVVSGTSWNVFGDFTCYPANLTSEQVDEVIQNVINEFASFNVVITTDETIYNKEQTGKKIRCILTESWEWYGQAGGVAFVNSFTWGDNTPCFVFTSLLNYNTKYIKEAVVHEIGHTMGLYHQSVYDANCNKVSEYRNGVNMGVGYYSSDEVVTWTVGPTYDCTSIQDDIAVLTQVIGLK